MWAYQFCDIAPNQEENIESWNDNDGWEQFVGFQNVGIIECHGHFYDACNGRNGKENEYVVPPVIIGGMVSDENQGRSSQLYEHMYAQYHEVEYRCQIREIHAF